MEDMGMTDKFPSPFGVRVLKCLLHKYEQQNLVKVSVPFRGSCSEMQKRRDFPPKPLKSFRPLSGFVF